MQLQLLNSKTTVTRETANPGGYMGTAISSNRLTTYYVIALLVIGCIALTSHIVEERSLASGKGIAATINISGRQRMYSQRIESLAEQYHRGDGTARHELETTIDEFEKTHDQLSINYISNAGTGKSFQALHRAYFVGANSVDKQVRTYIRNARKVGALPPNDPAMPALLIEMSAEARAPLLTALDEVVSISQKDSEEKLASLKALQWALLLIMGITLALEALLIFRPMVLKIVSISTHLFYQANVDQLTGVKNRRGFNAAATTEFDRFRRYRRPMAVIGLDIDHFKLVNDTFGHEAGDTVLKAVGAVLRSQLRPADIIGRIGGEEFALILPETSLEGAVAMAERIRHSVADLQIEHQSRPIRVTSSFGVAALLPDSLGIDSTFEMADNFLYRAKQTGRNRVVWDFSAK